MTKQQLFMSDGRPNPHVLRMYEMLALCQLERSGELPEGTTHREKLRRARRARRQLRDDATGAGLAVGTGLRRHHETPRRKRFHLGTVETFDWSSIPSPG